MTNQPQPPHQTPSDVTAARFDQAVAAQTAGRTGEAERLYRAVLAADLGHAAAAYNLAGLLAGSGRTDEALLLLEQAIRSRPEHLPYRLNHARVLRHAGRHRESVRALDGLLQRSPEDAQAYYELGVTLDMAGQADRALAAYARAAALAQAANASSTVADARFAAATLLARLDRRRAAVDELRQALEARPGDVRIESMLGGLLAMTGSIGEGIALTRRAAATGSTNPVLWWDHAAAATKAGEMPEAVDALHRVVGLAPKWSAAFSELLYALHHVHPANPASERQLAEEFGSRFGASSQTLPPSNRSPREGRRLRVGYLSYNFHDHPIARFIEPLWGAHDRQQIEVHAFDTHGVSDAFTARLRSRADVWHPVHDQHDADALAQRIRLAKLDVLIELDGHTGGNRLDAVARRVAPVQLSYLGYAGTTGLPSIDGRLTDLLTDPPGLTDDHYTERLLRLPGVLAVFEAPADSPPVVPREPSRPITLASAARPAKVNDAVLACWADALRRLPDARLIVIASGYDDAYVQQRVRGRLGDLQVDPQRVEFIGALPFDQYLQLHGRFDLMLDTFPFNCHTTTCQHLWMGVPMVTCAGTVHRGRLGASVLTAVGLTDLIAEGEAAFADRIVAVASDLDRLVALRQTLRQRMLASPLMDAQTFARDFEALVEYAAETYRDEADPR